ncbi:MAG TPA: helix-turn-helix domain-containing protein [Saprospiraceae bacterium]|nr:helix-turn-helix domain-containing protein [Saprospiraceae bacterium]
MIKAVMFSPDEWEDIQSKLDSIHTKLDNIQKSPALPEHWLSNREVSELLGVTKRTLQRYRDGGVLPFSHIGGKIFYKVSDLVRVLDKNYCSDFANEGSKRA